MRYNSQEENNLKLRVYNMSTMNILEWMSYKDVGFSMHRTCHFALSLKMYIFENDMDIESCGHTQKSIHMMKIPQETIHVNVSYK